MAWAQAVPGWQICWGSGCNVAVPLDAWMAAATSVLLLLAALTTLRRHTRGGLFLLAGALALSAYTLHEAQPAFAGSADVAITGPSGNQTLSCAIAADAKTAL